MRKKDFGVYFCEVRTNSGLAKTMSHDACIEELHKDHNSQATHETPLGLEQLRQIEGLFVCACVRACVRACRHVQQVLSIPLPYSSSPYSGEKIPNG